MDKKEKASLAMAIVKYAEIYEKSANIWLVVWTDIAKAIIVILDLVPMKQYKQCVNSISTPVKKSKKWNICCL